MGSDSKEERVEGKSIMEVQENYFRKELSKVPIYYYHGKMISVKPGEKVLALFQYRNNIIAYGLVIEKVKCTDKGYRDPHHAYHNYDGMLYLENGTVSTINSISVKELNKVLNKEIHSFSNAFHILDVNKTAFENLLTDLTKS